MVNMLIRPAAGVIWCLGSRSRVRDEARGNQAGGGWDGAGKRRATCDEAARDSQQHVGNSRTQQPCSTTSSTTPLLLARPPIFATPNACPAALRSELSAPLAASAWSRGHAAPHCPPREPASTPHMTGFSAQPVLAIAVSLSAVRASPTACMLRLVLAEAALAAQAE
eukprot:g17541.t1